MKTLTEKPDTHSKATSENSDTQDDELLKAFGGSSAFKTLFRLYKGNYIRLLLSSVVFGIKHAPSLVLPIVTSDIINIATEHSGGGMQKIIIDTVIILVLLLLNVPLNTLYTKLYSRAIRLVEANLRSSLVRKLQQLSISYHTHMQSGRLQSKIMRDVESIEGMSMQIFSSALMIVYDITFALMVTISKSFIVFVFFVIMIPLSVLSVKLFKKKLGESNSDFRKEVESTSAQVMEMVEMLPVTKAHGLEDVEISKMETRLGRVARKGYLLDVANSFFGAFNWALFQALRFICLAFTGYLAFRSVISVGEVVLYQSYFTNIVTQITAIVSLVPIISKGMDSVRSVGDILLAHDVENNKNKLSVPRVRGDIEFRNVSFSYEDSDKPVLDGFNLSVKAGETIAFVGESGSGKTTAMNMIIGFINASGGSLLIDGINIRKLNLKEYRHHLAVVPQNSILFSGSIKENITYGLPDVGDEDVWRVVDAANLREIVESLPGQLEAQLGEHASNLSGGQRQRISIARALIRNPSIIILDEATSALDTLSEKKIQSAINNMAAGRTTFIVAHRLSTIRDADKIVVVGEGKCKEMGTYEELMAKRGEFYRLNNH